MVLSAAGHGEPAAHRARYEALHDEAMAAADRLVTKAYLARGGPIRGPVLRRLVRVSRNLLPLREHHKFLFVRVLALVRGVIVEAGEQLYDQDALAAADDVWLLTWLELADAVVRPGADLRALVRGRGEAFERDRQRNPPRVITSDGEVVTAVLDRGNAPDGALVGSAVSAGVVEGVARVVVDPDTAVLEPGDILVAPFTDPGWTPLFVSAAGLVTEVGGRMTHGSVVAREYGIPAVVGVDDATRRIRTGQRIRVDGDAGFVEVLDVDVAASVAS
jgi:pyruvate,water dikinase